MQTTIFNYPCVKLPVAPASGVAYLSRQVTPSANVETSYLYGEEDSESPQPQLPWPQSGSDSNDAPAQESPPKIESAPKPFAQSGASQPFASLIKMLEQLLSDTSVLHVGGPYDGYDLQGQKIHAIVRYLIQCLHGTRSAVIKKADSVAFAGKLEELYTIIKEDPRLQCAATFVKDFFAALIEEIDRDPEEIADQSATTDQPTSSAASATGQSGAMTDASSNSSFAPPASETVVAPDPLRHETEITALDCGPNQAGLLAGLHELKSQLSSYDSGSKGIQILDELIAVAGCAKLDKQSIQEMAGGLAELDRVLFDSHERFEHEDVSAELDSCESDEEGCLIPEREYLVDDSDSTDSEAVAARRASLSVMLNRVSTLRKSLSTPPSRTAKSQELISDSEILMAELEQIKSGFAGTRYEIIIARMMTKLELIEHARESEPTRILACDNLAEIDDLPPGATIEARWHEIMGLFGLLHSARHNEKKITASLKSAKDRLGPVLKKMCTQFISQADPKSKAGFLKIFSAIRRACIGISDKRINRTFDLIWEVLLRREELSAEDWEFISLKLEKLVPLIPEKNENLFLNGHRIGFLKKNLDYLAFVSAAAWTESTHKNLVDYLTNEHYKKKFNESYTALDTHTLSFSVSMPGVSTSASTGRSRGLVTDDEGYLGRMDTTKAGLAVDANLGVSSVKLASVGAELTGSTGMYEEWNKTRSFVLDNFESLLSRHHADPKVAAYLSRIETGVVPQGLRTEIISDLTHTDDAGLRLPAVAVRNAVLVEASDKYRYQYMTETMAISMHTVRQTRTAYAQQSRFMAQSFSVLLSARSDINPTRPAANAAHQVALIKPDLLHIEQGNGLKVPYTAATGKFKSLVGLESELGSLNLSGTLEGSSSAVHLTSRTSMCEALRNTFEDTEYNYNPEIQSARRKQMTDEIVRKSLGIRSKLDADDRSFAKRRRVEKERLQTADHDGQQESIAELTFLNFSGKIWTDVSGTGSDAALTRNIEQLKLASKHLKASFNRYELLQTQLINGNKGAKEAVDAFHKMVGVESAEKCLYRMLLLNAWIYTQVLELEKSPSFKDSAATFKTELESQDQAILNCHCPVNLDTVKELATYQQDCDLTVKDIRLGGGATVAARPWGIEALAMGALQFFISALQRFRNHTNPLRHGNYRDIEIRIGAGFTAGSRKKSMEYIYQKITEQAGAECVFEEEDAQQLEKFLDSTTVTTGTLVLNFRWYKPTLFSGLGYRFWNMRASVSTDTTFSVSTPTPFFSAGYSYERVRADFLFEIYSSNSMLLMGLRYFHDYCNDLIDRRSGVVGPESYYGTVRELKAETLKSMFKKTGRMHDQKRFNYSVLQELDAIEREILTISGITTETRKKIIDERNKFMAAAAQFSADDSEANYAQTLAAFEALMQTYCPYLLSMKKKSALFKPKKFDLLDTRYHSDNVLLERISELFQRKDSRQSRRPDQRADQPATVQILPASQPPAAQPAA